MLSWSYSSSLLIELDIELTNMDFWWAYNMTYHLRLKQARQVYIWYAFLTNLDHLAYEAREKI